MLYAVGMDKALRQQLAAHGKRRRKALQNAEQEMEAIRLLARQALEDGATKAEIAALGRISRPTLDTLLRD